jgi:hypothetical protein
LKAAATDRRSAANPRSAPDQTRLLGAAFTSRSLQRPQGHCLFAIWSTIWM